MLALEVVLVAYFSVIVCSCFISSSSPPDKKNKCSIPTQTPNKLHTEKKKQTKKLLILLTRNHKTWNTPPFLLVLCWVFFYASPPVKMSLRHIFPSVSLGSCYITSFRHLAASPVQLSLHFCFILDCSNSVWRAETKPSLRGKDPWSMTRLSRQIHIVILIFYFILLF